MADRSLNATTPTYVSSQRTDDRVFLRALGAAVALHSLLLLGLWQAKPRAIGDLDGSDDPILVEIVSAGDMGPAGQPAPQAAAQPPSAATVPPSPIPPPVAAETEKAEPAPDPSEKPAEMPPEKLPEKQAAAPQLPDLADMPDLLALPDPKAQAKPAQKSASDTRAQQISPQKSKPVQTSKLDLSIPESMLSTGGASAGFSASSTRPPNITRSSQNDAFGRAVIAALRATMPPPDWPPNRVTIRILLNEQGNAIDVSVIRHSDDATLDQSVRFAALQASFPIPPAAATLADRTFLVTYIYR